MSGRKRTNTTSTVTETTEAKRVKTEPVKREQEVVAYPELLYAAKEAAALFGTTAGVAMREFERFVELKVFLRDTDAVKISPTPLMDAMWHAAILDTVFYAGLQVKLGMMIHHRPSGAHPEEAEARKKRLINLGNVYSVRYDSEPFGLAKEVPAPAAVPAVPAVPAAPARPRTAAPAVPHTLINIAVLTMTGRILHLRVYNSLRIEILKAIITDLVGVPVDQQRLIFSGRQLDDNRRLVEYNIGEGSQLHMILRLSGC
jgi:hypothetical protein